MRSRSAASLLNGQDFPEVFNMKGGIRNWEGATAAGPPDLGLFVFDDSDTAEDMLRRSYGMEEGLGAFYQTLGDRSTDEDITRLFATLASFEEKHKDRLYAMYQSITDSPADRTAFEASISAGIMEGGMSVDDFIASYEGSLKSPEQVLDLALSIETQALDLYLRFAQATEDDETKRLVFEIAEEEKAHLRYLGDLMGRKV